VARGSHLRTIMSGRIRMRSIFSFLRDDSGVTAIEYGLIASLIAVVIIGAVTLAGTNLSATFNTIAASI
jgi:pilus assembly protein Flp/PilA